MNCMLVTLDKRVQWSCKSSVIKDLYEQVESCVLILGQLERHYWGMGVQF